MDSLFTLRFCYSEEMHQSTLNVNQFWHEYVFARLKVCFFMQQILMNCSNIMVMQAYNQYIIFVVWIEIYTARNIFNCEHNITSYMCIFSYAKYCATWRHNRVMPFAHWCIEEHVPTQLCALISGFS